MKKLLSLLLFFIVIQALPVSGETQEAFMVEKYINYQNESKNPWIALSLSSMLPSLGHLYIENWGRGLLFLLADIGGIYIMSNREVKDGYYIGTAVLMISRVWEGIDAYSVAKENNLKIREYLGLKDASLVSPMSQDLEDILALYLDEKTQYTGGVGINNTGVGAITKDGLGFPRNIYGLNTLLGYSSTVVYGQPSIDEVVRVYNKSKTSVINKQKRPLSLLKDEFKNSTFYYFEFGNWYMFLPVYFYWGQIIMLDDNSRIKWGMGLPTLLSIGYSFDF